MYLLHNEKIHSEVFLFYIRFRLGIWFYSLLLPKILKELCEEKWINLIEIDEVDTTLLYCEVSEGGMH